MTRARLVLAITGVVVACGEPDGASVARDGVEIFGAVATASAAPDISSLYFTIRNDGAASDTLVGVVTAPGRATLHTVETVEGRSSMQPVARLPIPPRSRVRLEPGSYHVMLTQLPAPLRVGDSVRLSVVFSRSDTLTLVVPVLTYTDAVERLDATQAQAP